MLKFDDVTEAKADRRIGFMRAAFPDAEVTGYEDLIDSMTNHPKDRHVLAAAVRADAAVIVTANLKDFPRSALDPYDLDAMGPDDFLLNQLDLYPQQTVQCCGSWWRTRGIHQSRWRRSWPASCGPSRASSPLCGHGSHPPSPEPDSRGSTGAGLPSPRGIAARSCPCAREGRQGSAIRRLGPSHSLLPSRTSDVHDPPERITWRRQSWLRRHAVMSCYVSARAVLTYRRWLVLGDMR